MTLEMQSRGTRRIKEGYASKDGLLHEAVAIERTISDSVAVIYERNKFVYGGSASTGAGAGNRTSMSRQRSQQSVK